MADLKFPHQFESCFSVDLHLAMALIHVDQQSFIEICVTLAMMELHLFETSVISPLPARPRAAGPQLSSYSFLVPSTEPPLLEDYTASCEHLAASRSDLTTLRRQSAPTEIFFESISSIWERECSMEL